MFTAYIGLGSNVGDRFENMKQALFHINNITNTELIKVSPVYESDPMYVEDQEKFYNAVAEIKTGLDPVVLLMDLKKIEKKMGRDFQTKRNGPRIIDLDIEFFDDLVVDTDNLEIPHPRLYERCFVLRPLSELNENYKCSKTGKTVKKLLQECKDYSSVEKVAEFSFSSLKSY